MFSTIIEFIKNEPKFTISIVLAVVSFIVNIILAICSSDKSKLKEALLSLPQVISTVEELSKERKMSAIEKKAMAEAICHNRFGRCYRTNAKLFDDAIEDILKTPQKKGGSDDVSKESQKIKR